MAIPKINETCSPATQDILQLFDDKCYKIVKVDKTGAEFCMDDFAFPTDGASCISLEVAVSGDELILFDNEILVSGSPIIDLVKDKIYVRGILLKVTYPTNDTNGEEILIEDKSVDLWIEDAETLVYKKFPIHNFFALFTNPKSNDPRELINRIKIVNPNLLYSVTVSAIIIYGKVNK